MSLKKKLRTLVEKEINRATSTNIFENKESLLAMGDADLADLATKSGIEELIVRDGEGNLTDESKNEIVQSLCNLENSADDIEENIDEVDMGQADRTLRRTGKEPSSGDRWGIKVDGKPSVNYFSSEAEAEAKAEEWKRLPQGRGKTIEAFKAASIGEAELDEADRKVSPFDAYEFLKNNEWLDKDFFRLSHSDINILLDYAKQVKYRKSPSAPGSTGRMFFYYLTNLANKWTKKDIGEAYSDKNPKIDLYNKSDGKYLASTNYSKTVKDAVKAYEDKYPKLKGNVKGSISESIQESEGNNMNYDDKFYVYDNGGAETEEGSIDRYTIILKADVEGEPDRRGMIPALASGVDPKGYMQHVELYLSDVVDMLTAGEEFLGKEIPFSELPDAVQSFAISDYKDQLNSDINEAEGDEDEEELPNDEDQEEELPLEDEPSDEGEEELPDEEEGEAEKEKITVVVISPELKKNDEDDDENQDSYNLENKDLINTNEHVAALFNGETLSEEFQAKAKVIFEAALAEHTKALRDKFVKEFRIRESKIQKKFDAQVQEVKESLIKEQAKLIDGYLSEAVDTWVAENQMVLESNIRTELTEEFIDGLKNLFAESYIEVPVEKFDLIKAQESKINELEESLKVERKRTRLSLKEAKRLHCESIITKQTSDMTEVEKAKFIKLVESVEFDSIEQFEKKIKVLKESYSRKTSVLKEKTDSVRNKKVETSVIIEQEQLNSPIDQISDALGSVLSVLNK